MAHDSYEAAIDLWDDTVPGGREARFSQSRKKSRERMRVVALSSKHPFGEDGIERFAKDSTSYAIQLLG